MAQKETDNRENIYRYRIIDESLGWTLMAGGLFAIFAGLPEIGVPAFLAGINFQLRSRGNELLEEDNQTRELKRAQGLWKLVNPVDLKSYREKRQRSAQHSTRR